MCEDCAMKILWEPWRHTGRWDAWRCNFLERGISACMGNFLEKEPWRHRERSDWQVESGSREKAQGRCMLENAHKYGMGRGKIGEDRGALLKEDHREAAWWGDHLWEDLVSVSWRSCVERTACGMIVSSVKSWRIHEGMLAQFCMELEPTGWWNCMWLMIECKSWCPWRSHEGHEEMKVCIGIKWPEMWICSMMKSWWDPWRHAEDLQRDWRSLFFGMKNGSTVMVDNRRRAYSKNWTVCCEGSIGHFQLFGSFWVQQVSGDLLTLQLGKRRASLCVLWILRKEHN